MVVPLENEYSLVALTSKIRNMKKAANGKAAAKPRKAAAGPPAHKLAPTMPEGTVLNDFMKGSWKLGRPVGSGGFGLIYLTQSNSSSPVGDNAEYVMKIEPHDNGPLFCELNFYQRAAKADQVKEWMSKRSLKTLGMPKFVAAGQHEKDGKKYRFMVMQRFGTDLQKLFETNGKRFPPHTVFLLGLRLIDVLEYMHEKGFAHADIKAGNLMTGYKDQNTVYLIDYGLAFRYMIDGQRKEYKEDPRKAHDGTIEFTSRDAHKGVVPAPRGDLEILGYCMLQWLCGKLPWEDNLANKDYVSSQKFKYMKDVKGLIAPLLPDNSSTYSKEFCAFLEEVVKSDYTATPNYDAFRQLFTRALKQLGHKSTDHLEFHSAGDSISSPKPVKKATKKESESNGRPSAASRKRRSTGEAVEDSTSANDRLLMSPPPSKVKKIMSAPKPSPSTSEFKKPSPAPAKKRPKKPSASIATQTSPGLKGLPRSRKQP